MTNASSTYQGVAQNSSLLTGPDLQCKLTDLGMKFQKGALAIFAFIDAMLMQVNVKPEDQPVLRFLWPENGQYIPH